MLLDKIRREVLAQDVAETPSAPVGQTILPAEPPRRDRRGRLRRAYPKKLYTAEPLVLRWVQDRLVPAEGNVVLVGAHRPPTFMVGRQKAQLCIDYADRPTLVGDFLQWLQEHNRAASVPQSFSGLIVRYGISQGWPVYLGKTAQRRRVCIVGVNLKGATPWRGDDRDREAEARGEDRKRWVRRSRTDHP